MFASDWVLSRKLCDGLWVRQVPKTHRQKRLVGLGEPTTYHMPNNHAIVALVLAHCSLGSVAMTFCALIACGERILCVHGDVQPDLGSSRRRKVP